MTIELGPLEEACALGLAPSTSTTAMLAVGDALALVVSQMRRFSREDFARFHPGRQPGLQAEQGRASHAPAGAVPRGRARQQTVREVLVGASMPGRRTGATMLVDAEGRLSGIFTDSDLARLFEHRRDQRVGPSHRPGDDPAVRCGCEVGSMMVDAVAIMAGRKISELPVVDADGKPIGLIDITDVVAMLPKEAAASRPYRRRRNRSRGAWWANRRRAECVTLAICELQCRSGTQWPASRARSAARPLSLTSDP